MVIGLERGADLHTAQLMPLPLTVSCFSKILIGFTRLVPAHLGSPGKGPLNGCVCVIAESLSEKKLKSVNIWHSYKQKRDGLVHFLRLLAVRWPGTQSAQDNHDLCL